MVCLGPSHTILYWLVVPNDLLFDFQILAFPDKTIN